MSRPTPPKGLNLIMIIIVLGVFGSLFYFWPALVAFVLAVGYYLYKLDKRATDLEQRLGVPPPPAEKEPEQQ